MKKISLFILCVSIVLAISACGSSKPNDLNYKVDSFQYTDQEGAMFSLADLENKVFIANFIFTHCTTVCPMLTANMAELQKELKAAGAQTEIVSFSVDPENDSPDALKKYIGKFKGDFANWHALTGYTFENIQKFARQSFKSAVQKDTKSDQVIHGTSFFLADKSGTIVSKYDGLDTPIEQIIKDVKALNR